MTRSTVFKRKRHMTARTPDERRFLNSVLPNHRYLYKIIPGSEPEREYIDIVLKEFRERMNRL